MRISLSETLILPFIFLSDSDRDGTIIVQFGQVSTIFDRFLSISDNFLPMTGEQLKNVRTGKGMTRAAFATWLGGTTASTLNKWERGISAVPEWVDRRIASPDELVLPIDLIGGLIS